MRHDPLLMVRSDLLKRIEKLQRDSAILALADMCDLVDEVRAIARRHGFEAIERLASMLESVVAYNGHRQVAATYLSLMHDAVEGDAVDPAACNVFMAAAALRGCRPHS